MPFDYMASSHFEMDHSEAGGTCGDNSEFQDDDIPSLLPSESEDPGQDSDVEVVKSRPQRSPYASDIIALRFSPSQTLRIPRQFLEKTPLATRLLRCHPPNEIDLGSIQFEAGHVIVNFLVTGKYQCLEPWGTTAAGKNSSEFRTALRVYIAAESVCLTELFNVAQAEIKKVGDKLSFPQVVDNVHFLNPFHAHFPWIGEYIQSRMVSFWESTTVEQAAEMTADVPGPSNLHKILINGLLKMKASSSWPREREPSIRDTKSPEAHVEEDLIFPSPLAEKLRAANERMLKLAADLKTAGVLKSGSSSSPKQPERLIQLPQFTLLHETPDLPPKKSVKEVEQRAVLEQSELRSLKSKIIGREKAGLELSWVDHRRAELLEQKSQRRADVVNAKIDWDQIDSQQDKAEAAVKGAISIEGMFHEIWRDDSSNMAKVIFFRALRKKYQSEKLEAMAKRKAAVERYQSSTSEPDHGHYSETVSHQGSSTLSSLSTGQRTPDSSDASSTVETCLELESHLSTGSWRGCGSCRILLMETIQDMTDLPELEVSED